MGHYLWARVRTGGMRMPREWAYYPSFSSILPVPLSLSLLSYM